MKIQCSFGPLSEPLCDIRDNMSYAYVLGTWGYEMPVYHCVDGLNDRLIVQWVSESIPGEQVGLYDAWLCENDSNWTPSMI